MKILKTTNKEFNKKTVKNLFNYTDFNDGDKVIAEAIIPFESNLAKKNVDFINKNLIIDEDTINYLIESNLDELDEQPVITYPEYLSMGIEYVTKIKDGKIYREVLVNDALKRLVTSFDVTIGPVDMETDDEQITLVPWSMFGGEPVFDYETIYSVIPNVVKVLLDNGYAEIVEIED